ncbi:FtsK/SpoIIIE domain-containing protein [Amphibacillus sediminis]|uniref:FtsK/SpoIIIE domain-containing protein n=1 Tax=Amphibacillus sediminis TaxID=360185 RepID=UPI00082D6D6C|nr:FtsK/SpoIIIE domain-containing protein [Amphibacillus sediminis]
MFKNRKIKVKFYGVNLKFKLYYYAVLLILLALLITLSMYIEVEYFGKFKWSIVIIFLISVFFEYFTSEFSLSESQRIKAKLKKVIRDNKLFIKRVFLNDSIEMKFYTKEKHLYVEAYPKGVDYLSKLEKLGKVIETTLSLSLIDSKNNNADRFTYIFEKNKPNRIYVQHELFKNNRKGIISLDSEKSWNYSKYPHAIVAGKTGGGKTYFIYYLILSFLSQNSTVFIGDPKQKDLYSLKHIIGEKYVESSANGIAKILRLMYEEMDKRNEIMTEGGLNDFGKDYRDYNLSPVVGVFDEISVVKNDDLKVAKEIDRLLAQVIMKGRQYGVFVILATQKPDAETIPTNIRDQISLRVSLGKMYREGLKMTLGDDFDELPAGEQSQGQGFIFIDGEGWSMPRTFKSPWFKNNEIDLFKAVSKYN